MAVKVSGKNGFFGYSKTYRDLQLPIFAPQLVADAQRKNIEALTQANQLALDGARLFAQRQSEIVQQAFAQASALLRDLLQPSEPEERVARTAEAAKRVFDQNMATMRELNELGAKASADVFSVMARRVSEGFNEMRLFAKKQAVTD